MNTSEPTVASHPRPPVAFPTSPSGMSVLPSGLQDRSPAAPRTNIFWPALLLTGAVVGAFATQTWQLVEDRSQLLQVQQAQQAQVDASTQIRGSLDALANATARLAAAGNANAATMVKALRDRGITINPPAAAPPK